MGQSGASASDLRGAENKNGFAQHSKGPANQPETARRGADQKPTYAGWRKQRLEAHYEGGVGRTVSWEVRCPELNMMAWEVRSGPDDGWKMARHMAAIIDHDEARVIAFGGKKYTIELRIPGREAIEHYAMSGICEFRYSAHKIA